jgi:hypothetical protein
MIRTGRNCPVLSIPRPELGFLRLECEFLAVISLASLDFRYRARYRGEALTLGDDRGRGGVGTRPIVSCLGYWRR